MQSKKKDVLNRVSEQLSCCKSSVEIPTCKLCTCKHKKHGWTQTLFKKRTFIHIVFDKRRFYMYACDKTETPKNVCNYIHRSNKK